MKHSWFTHSSTCSSNTPEVKQSYLRNSISTVWCITCFLSIFFQTSKQTSFPSTLIFNSLYRKFLLWCKRVVLQYVFIKPSTAFLSILLDELGLYDEGHFKLDAGYVYILVINNISVTVTHFYDLVTQGCTLWTFIFLSCYRTWLSKNPAL